MAGPSPNFQVQGRKEPKSARARADLARTGGLFSLTPWRAAPSADAADSRLPGRRLLHRRGRDQFGALGAGLHCAALAGVWVAVLPLVPFAVLIASLVPKGRKLHKPAVAGRA